MRRWSAILCGVILLLAGVVPSFGQVRSEVVELSFASSGAELVVSGARRGDSGVDLLERTSGSLSAVHSAPFPFSAVAVVVRGKFPADLDFGLQVRFAGLEAGGGEWVRLALDEDGSRREAGLLAYGLVLLPGALGRGIECRMDFRAGATAGLLASLSLQFIDATSGPSDGELLLALETPAKNTGLAVTALPKPQLISRGEWGAQAPKNSPSYCDPTTHVGLHHSASIGLGDSTQEECASHVRSIQSYHMNSLGWNDVGYNYLVCSNGMIFEGRGGGDNVRGAHDGYNCDSMGVVSMGYHHAPYDEEPTSALLNSLVDLFAWKASQNGIDPFGQDVYRNFSAVMDNIYGHRNVKETACPGDLLYPWLGWIRDQVDQKLGGVGGGTGNLVGLILDAQDESRISGALCSLSPGSETYLTGSDGLYRFSDLEAGQTYTVTVTHADYQSDSKSKAITEGIDNWNSLWLDRHATATASIR